MAFDPDRVPLRAVMRFKSCKGAHCKVNVSDQEGDLPPDTRASTGVSQSDTPDGATTDRSSNL